MSIRRALVVRSGAVGDCILTIPVFRLLGRCYPSAEIDVLGNPTNLEPIVSAGLAGRSVSIDRAVVSPMFGAESSIPDRTAAIFRDYDLVVSYLPDHDGRFRRNLKASCTARVLSGKAHPAPDSRLHMSHVLQSILVENGIGPSERLPPDLSSLSTGSGFPRLIERLNIPGPDRPFIVLHPGAGSPEKRWPVPNWCELIRIVRAMHLAPVVTEGPADRSIIDAMRQDLGDEMPRCLSNLPLVELGQLIAGCHGFVGNDTGVSHLAAAVGTPTIALFGPTDPAIWAPRGRMVEILWGGRVIKGDAGIPTSVGRAAGTEALADISVEQVAMRLELLPADR